MATEAAARPPYLAVALLSGAVIALEIALIGWFSLIQWHHFAYLVVGVALLGFGASGTFLALAGARLAGRLRGFATAQAALFALAAVAAPALAQRLSFDPELLVWDPAHWLRLAAVILLLMLPFFCAACAIALALAECRARLARVYAADLLGAGAGALAIVAALYRLSLPAALVAIALLGIAAAAAFWIECGGRRRPALALAAAAALGLALPPADWRAPELSPYKAMSQLLRVPGARVLAEASSPLGRVNVVDPGAVPLRHAPGLSLNATAEPPPQLALLVDGGALGAINRYRGERDALAFLDQTTAALPYHLRAARRVLVLGAGGGAEVLQARYHGAARIDAVELDPRVIAMVRERFGAFAGGVYDPPRVSVHIADARAFLQRDGAVYDLVQVPPLDAFSPVSAGVHGLNENFVYTVEALGRALDRLAPDGLLALTRWLRLPPRDAPKLFAAALDALRAAGVERPRDRLALIRGLQTSTLVVKNGPLSRAEIERLRAFCAARAFDLVYFPGIVATDANRYNRLAAPWFHDAAQALLGPGRARFIADYPFDLRPATDDRPYHFHFARWRTLREGFAARARGGGALLETGYLALLATLLLSLAAGVLLILAPLARLRAAATGNDGGRARVLVYFCALGLGFLMLEIALLHKFMLLLHHPVTAAATVLAAFLVAAGLGSACAQPLAARLGGRRRAARLAAVGILLLGGAYLWWLGPLIDHASGWSTPARVGLCLALLAPLGFCLGLPFPLGLAAIAGRRAALLPWAWGINGCASVVAAALATLLAVHAGFNAVIGAALACYLCAAAAFPAARGDSREMTEFSARGRV